MLPSIPVAFVDLTLQPYPISSQVQLIDRFGNGVLNEAVEFAFAVNGGVSPVETTTGILGQAEASGPTDLSDIPGNSVTVTVTVVDLIGNQAATSITFEKDTSPPVITIVSPLDGSLFESTNVPLQVTIADDISGVSEVTVSLNGLDITDLITVTLGSITLTGTLPAVEGTNILVVSVDDLAGNQDSIEVFFSVAAAQEGLVLQVISGNNQIGSAGLPAKDEIKVRLVGALSNVPVSGTAIIAVAIQNVGVFGRSNTVTLSTDENGVAGFRYVYSDKPDTNIFHVGVTNDPSIEPVEFTLTGTSPTFEFVDPVSIQTLSDFPGSGLPGLIQVRAQGPDDDALVGQRVLPMLLDGQGQVIQDTEPIGSFRPSSALTNSEGIATFAFRIADNATPNPITLAFTLADFQTPAGDALLLTTGATILDTANQLLSITEGQDQVGLVGKTLSQPMRVHANTPPGQAPSVEFKTFLGGHLAFETGSFSFATAFDSEGNVISIVVFPDSNGDAGVTFTMGGKKRPHLVNAFAAGVAAETFVVSVPEARVVQMTESGLSEPAFVYGQTQLPVEQRLVHLEIVVPVGEPFAVKVAGLSIFSEDKKEKGAVASNLISPTMSLVETSPGFEIYRSTKPILPTTAIVSPGDVATEPGEDLLPLQITKFGSLHPSIVFGADDEYKVHFYTQVVQMLERGQFGEGGPLKRRPFIFPKGSEISFRAVIPPGLKKKNNLAQGKWVFDMTDTEDQQGFTLEKVGNEVTHKYLPNENLFNRRRTFVVDFEITDGILRVLPSNVRVALGTNKSIKTPAVGSFPGKLDAMNPQKADEIQNFVNANFGWTDFAAPVPGGPVFVAVEFAVLPDPDPFAAFFPNRSLKDNRLTFIPFGLKFGAEPTGRTLAVTIPSLDRKNSFGVYLSASALAWGYDGLVSTVRHERRHVAELTAVAAGDSLYSRLQAFMKTRIDPANPNALATLSRLQDMNDFEEARLGILDLLDSDNSFRNLGRIGAIAIGIIIDLTTAGQAEGAFIENYNKAYRKLILNVPTTQLNGGRYNLENSNLLLFQEVKIYLLTQYKLGVNNFPEFEARDEFLNFSTLDFPE